jgi:hypothetical protein
VSGRHIIIIAVTAGGAACIGPLARPARAAEPARRAAAAEMTPEAERAIARGLEHLLFRQREDGSWGSSHRVAVTALSVMAFLANGFIPEREPHGRTVASGVDFLIVAGRAGGGFIGESMYEHALATLALSEAWGMSSRSEALRDLLKRAVDVILRSQNRQGGWRYYPRPDDADISVTVMQVVALNSAREAGIVVPDATIAKAIGFVLSCRHAASGGFGYQGPNDPGFARTAAGVTSLLLAGRRGSEEVLKGLDYLRTSAGGKGDSEWFFYGQYYAAQAMYQAGEEAFAVWYPRVRDLLVSLQRKDGSWSEEYGTPMAILTLSIPTRFLPIHQR